ncbi:MAG: DNA translocase FtsK [Microscillaceae bacterium]|nr:DNA translocase FtsK [Microscillaceae bacterium]MDW8461324.1 DNA translocase FtsK [Cytophagales bacterium]
MAKTYYRENTYKNQPKSLSSFFVQLFAQKVLANDNTRQAIGLFLLIASFGCTLAFTSYIFTGKADQSIIDGLFSTSFTESGKEVENWLGLSGALIAHFFIFKLFGIASFALLPVFFAIGWELTFKSPLFEWRKSWKIIAFILVWVSTFFGYLAGKEGEMSLWSGAVGFEIAFILQALIGAGTWLVLIVSLLVFVVYVFKVNTKFDMKNNIFTQIIKEFKPIDKSEFNQFKQALKTENTAPQTTNANEETKLTPINQAANHSSNNIILEIEDFETTDVENNTERNFNKQTSTNQDKHTQSLTDQPSKGEQKEESLPKTTPQAIPKEKAIKTETKNKKISLEINPESLPTQDPLQLEEEISPLDTPYEMRATGLESKIRFKKLEENAPENDNLESEENFDDLNEIKGLKSIKDVKKVINDEDTADELQDSVFKSEIGEYDPTLELSRYQKPTPELLNEPPISRRQVTNEELEANKDKIVETLSNYGIGISQIKATIGPTITLYEIIPEAGVRITRIKNLEDDIALSLSALGIRIIAPIPGKGTIGIEVPNKKREIVTMRSVIEEEAFKNTDKTLPIILGKTISNEVYVADLAKMPHLLIAGATGQGKSVGLNVFLASLLYRRHPAELKFVLIDPKKVELTIFNKIERHFLAKLPGDDEAIITDTKKVIHTLNSLCLEMDNRYNLLKDAACRNIKEYNKKFKQRKLNPKKGHRYLPYIVLVIDELADLMMTAGKEVEQPIARLAQLARAIGIHLIVATQRPSVNVITGIIKANFPARIAFKVTSKIDSRVILDMGGAEQLVGMGDMLFTMGSDVIRLQCPFLDTPEIERICDFIGEQQSYPSAYELPEVPMENTVSNEVSSLNTGDEERDSLFEEAARIIVLHQQGSTSLLQRKLKLGYNRAGRIIDQLEKAGIVGPFEGSKAREVLVPDEYALERLLNSLNK